MALGHPGGRWALAEVFSIGVGPDVDPQLLEQMAATPDRFYAMPDADGLRAMYATVRACIQCP